MKLGVLGTVALLVLPTLRAQTACPPINFLSAAELPQLSTGTGYRYVLARQADGSFTELDYVADYATVQSTHVVTKIGSTPNIQKNMVACLGFGSRTRHPAPANLKADQLGITIASSPVTADLAGNGIGSLLGFWNQAFLNQLIVENGASDYSVASSTGYPVGAQPTTIAVADFNGDGKKDVAVVYFGPPTGNTGGGISLLSGNGDGTLKPAVDYPIAGQFAEMVTVYDFNGDGLPDLAVASYQGGITILLGNRNGTLTKGNTYATGSTAISSLAVSDLNGDSKADLLVFLGGTGIAVFNGNGDGTFQTGTPIPLVKSYAYIATGDFNKDGVTDLALAVPGEGVSIMLGTGGGKFSTPVIYGARAAFASAFYVEDFDGDGNLDLVFSEGHPDELTPPAGGSGAVRVLFGMGDGTFAGPMVAGLDGDPFDQTYAPTNVVTADFNGDGKPDVATANASGKSISILLGQGAAGFKTPKSYSMGTVQPNAIAAGDFTGDGKPEVVVTDGKSNIDIFTNNGDGTFQTPIPFPVNGTTPNFIAVGDFNNDKKLDLVTVNGGSNDVSILLGFGDASFKPGVNYPVGSKPVNVVVGDFNGDGKLDLAVANSGTFSTAGTKAGGISVLLGNGDGTFNAAVNYPSYDTPVNYPVFVALGDVDGDQKLDLVVVAKQPDGTNAITALLGNGDGTFKPAFLAAYTGFGPSGIVLADFNGDGKLDALVSHCCGEANLTVLAGSGNGDFGSLAEIELASGSYFSTAVADFNGDGKPDVATTSFSPGSPHIISTFLNVSAAAQGTLAITSAAGNPFVAPPVAPFSIATAQGTDLATGILINRNAVPPTNMLGTTMTVTDSQGVARPAQLFYVSPGQVNFLIPQDTAIGNATFTITSGDGFVSSNTAAIAAVAPSIFTLNSNSLVAAYVQRVHGDLTQSIQNLYAVDAGGNVSFPPIDLGPSTDQVYLNVYGTGISGSPKSAVTVTVGGANAKVFYAGVSTFPGEDQVVILLPRSLVGAGTVDVILTASGNEANNTTLNIK